MMEEVAVTMMDLIRCLCSFVIPLALAMHGLVFLFGSVHWLAHHHATNSFMLGTNR